MSTTNRRTVLKSLIITSSAASSTGLLSSFTFPKNVQPMPLKKNINHSVCRWTYDFLSVEELCKTVTSIGFNAIDLCGIISV